MSRLLRNRLTAVTGIALLSLLLVSLTFARSNGDTSQLRIDTDYPNARLGSYAVDSDDLVRFAIARDPGDVEALWFRFKVHADKPVRPTFIIENSREVSQQNWPVVRPVFSLDGKNWQPAIDARMESSLRDRISAKLSGRPTGYAFRAPFKAKEFEVAYAYPYDQRNLQDLLTFVKEHPSASVSSIGRSGMGRDIPLLTLGSRENEANAEIREVWIIGREHPGESPSSFVVEGLTRTLLEQIAEFPNIRFQIVPMLNIDGVANGLYYRTPAGVDLSKDWGSPVSAETRALLQAMSVSLKEKRIALFLSAHAANAPLSHFMIEALRQMQSQAMFKDQERVKSLLQNIHPQFSLDNSIDMWDLPGIAGNLLPQQYGVYCLYIESNYSIGADGTRVSEASLQEFGASLGGFMRSYLEIH